MHTIYLIRKDEKPIYVGYTSRSMMKRWREHQNNSKHPKSALHHAINTCCLESFSIEKLYESEDKNHTLHYMEHHYIWLYKTHVSNGGCNLNMGGQGTTKQKTNKSLQQYRKEWYQTNKEKIKCWEKENKEHRRQQQKAWREVNKEVLREKRKIWYERNRERHIERVKANYQTNKKTKETNFQYKSPASGSSDRFHHPS